MSVIDPTIDELLSVTEENRFLLCEVAARRACDINDMMRNQHNRAEQFADIEDITMFLSDEEGHAPNPLTIAFNELAPAETNDEGLTCGGELSYDHHALDISLGLDRGLYDPIGMAEVVEEISLEAPIPADEAPKTANAVSEILDDLEELDQETSGEAAE